MTEQELSRNGADPLPALSRRDGIPPAGVPGMASRDAPERKERAPERAVARQRLQGICGAGRREPAARPAERAQQELVAADQGHEHGGRGPPHVTTGT